MPKFTCWSLLIIISTVSCARIPVTPTTTGLVSTPEPPTAISAVPDAIPSVSTLDPHIEIFASATTLNIGDVITVTGQAVDIELPYYFHSGFEDQGMTGDDDENKGLPYASQVLRLIALKDDDRQTVLTIHGQSTGSTRITISAKGQSESLLITVLPPYPEIKWDTRPEALIVRGTQCCGYVSGTFIQNYIPDVKIWGDGRIIWTQYSFTQNTSRRRVLEAHLTPEQMTELLQRAVNDGFFGWKDEYIEPDAYDYPYQCLSIGLASMSKMVCEYAEGAPQAYHTLYDYLADGIGMRGTDFGPTQGYLDTTLPNYGNQPSTPTPWLTDSLGFSLSEATDGKWIEGEALALAWRAVNANPWEATLQEGEVYYLITVKIPGFSEMEPPPSLSLRGEL